MPLTPELAGWRKRQRERLLAQRMAVAPALHARWNAQITGHLLALLVPQPGMVLAGYWPFKGEFDPRFAMRAWRDRAGRTALPVVVQRAAPLEFREWRPGTRTHAGVYGLPVPEGSAVVQPAIALIPPIGFDALGYRLGYGGGFYDRTLAAMAPGPLKIGVAFELSRIDSIRPQPHDIAMDMIVTPDAVCRVTPQGLKVLDAASARQHVASLWSQ